jgi:hypothetical protein
LGISIPPSVLLRADEVIEQAAICCAAYVGSWQISLQNRRS